MTVPWFPNNFSYFLPLENPKISCSACVTGKGPGTAGGGGGIADSCGVGIVVANLVDVLA